MREAHIHTIVVNETEWAMIMAALIMYAQACKDNGEDEHGDNANTLVSRLFVSAVEQHV